MILWANAHGGFIVGLLALAAYVAGWIWQAWRGGADRALGLKLLLVSLTSLLASILTPDLWRNWDAVMQNRSIFILSRTVETRALDISTAGTWPFLGLLILAAALLSSNRHSVIPAHAFLLGGLTLMSLSVERNIPFFAIGAAPILVVWLRSLPALGKRWLVLEEQTGKIDATLRGALWPAIVVLAVIGWLSYRGISGQGALYRFSPTVFPVDAANWIEDNPPPGNMLNDLNWGGYLLYRLWPGQRVFIDSQTDFYGEILTRQYEALVTATGGWQTYLKQYDISWVVAPPSSRLAAILAHDPSWVVLYQDPTATIVGKRGSP
jgi:hypothetical protein